LALLQESGKEFQMIRYLTDIPSKTELKQILTKLGMGPAELIRQTEPIWKEKFAGKKMRDEELINAMIKFPKLIERPIVVNGDNAVIARPAEKINELY
jgi:arsenate reductase